MKKCQFASLLAMFCLAACTTPIAQQNRLLDINGSGSASSAIREIKSAAGGIYKIGTPYKISGETYYPQEDVTYVAEGIGSWYGSKFHGKRTANGETFDMELMTAAHPTLPMPVWARVTNLENQKTIIVRINDRGPFKSNREIDLSRRAAREIGYLEQGTARVRVEYLGRAPLYNTSGKMTYKGETVNMAKVQERIRHHKVIGSLPYQPRYVAKPKTPSDQRKIAGAHPIQDVEQLSLTSLEKHTDGLSTDLTDNPGADTYAVQIGVYSSQEWAESIAAKFEHLATTRIGSVYRNGQQLYRLQLGEVTQQGAYALLTDVETAGFSDAIIVKLNQGEQ